jgi:hypothetical protein
MRFFARRAQNDRNNDDPYWDTFINRPPADPNNLLPHAFRQVPPGGVNPVKTEVHSPNIMASHVKGLGRFYGAHEVGIVQRGDGEQPPFAIVCTLKADYDTRTARGLGGQTPAVKGMFTTFTLAAYIRELGYVADRVELDDAGQLAEAAGLRTRGMYVADVILTDLPLEPDSRSPLPLGGPSDERATGASILGASRGQGEGGTA